MPLPKSRQEPGREKARRTGPGTCPTPPAREHVRIGDNAAIERWGRSGSLERVAPLIRPAVRRPSRRYSPYRLTRWATHWRTRQRHVIGRDDDLPGSADFLRDGSCPPAAPVARVRLPHRPRQLTDARGWQLERPRPPCKLAGPAAARPVVLALLRRATDGRTPRPQGVTCDPAAGAAGSTAGLERPRRATRCDAGTTRCDAVGPRRAEAASPSPPSLLRSSGPLGDWRISRGGGCSTAQSMPPVRARRVA